MVLLTTYLSPSSVLLDVAAVDKAAVLQRAASCLAAAEPMLDADQVATLLAARERVASTGVGEGIAIPHACSAAIDVPRLSVLRIVDPVDFDAVDGKPVNLIVAVLAPPHAQALHLRLLARVARLVRSPATREALLAAQSSEEAYSVIGAAEGGRVATTVVEG